jgi:hypothetical protein
LRRVLDEIHRGGVELQRAWSRLELDRAREAIAADAPLEADHHFLLATQLTQSVPEEAARWWQSRYGILEHDLERSIRGQAPEMRATAQPLRWPAK